MDTWQVTQGIDAAWQITLRDEDDAPVTTYTGHEPIVGTIRPGRSVAPVATLAPTWADAARGLVDVPIPASATAPLAAGLYLVQVKLADGGADFFEGLLEVAYGPGQDALPPAYCSFDDLLDYASWIEKLQTPKDLTGFARQRGRARSWLDDILVGLWKPQGAAPQAGQPGFGAWLTTGGRDPAPGTWLRDQLAAGGLIVRDQVREITAKRAIYLIGMPQLARLEQSEQTLARAYGREAEQLVKLYRAEIDLPDASGHRDGFADIIVNCGATSLR